MDELRLELIALDLVWSDPQANLARMESAIADRLSEKAGPPADSRIFVFPELTLTGFVLGESRTAALQREDAVVQAVRDLAKKYGTAIVFGFPEAAPGAELPLNTLLFVSPEGGDLADYQKIHLYSAGSRPEAECYERGEAATQVIYRGWRIGFAICFDLRFPALFQSYAEAATDVIILIACWIGGPGKALQFKALAAGHAIASQCFFAALNRSGKDPSAEYEGDVWCFAPSGEPLKGDPGFALSAHPLSTARRLPLRPCDLAEYRVLTEPEDWGLGR